MLFQLACEGAAVDALRLSPLFKWVHGEHNGNGLNGRQQNNFPLHHFNC